MPEHTTNTPLPPCLRCGGFCEPEHAQRGMVPCCQGCRYAIGRMPQRKRQHVWRKLQARARRSPA